MDLYFGGKIAPGLSPGTLVIDGDLAISGGTLEFEVFGSGAGEFDVLDVMGTLDASAAFGIDLIFGAGATVEDLLGLALFSAGSFGSGFFSNASVNFVGLGGYSGALTQVDGGYGILATPTSVPLPAGLVLLASAAGALGLVRRRRLTA